MRHTPHILFIMDSNCDPGGIQTHDLQNRNLMLYSAKLQGRLNCECEDSNNLQRNNCKIDKKEICKRNNSRTPIISSQIISIFKTKTIPLPQTGKQNSR